MRPAGGRPPTQPTLTSWFASVSGQPPASLPSILTHDDGQSRMPPLASYLPLLAHSMAQSQKPPETSNIGKPSTGKPRGKKSEVSQGGKKRLEKKGSGKGSGMKKTQKTNTSHGEEDIDLTDHEEEVDEEADSDDQRFLDDGEHDETGMEQAACENDGESEGNDLQAYVNAIQEVSGKGKGRKLRRRDDDDEFEDVKKKKRSEKRSLLVLHERGKGDTVRTVFEYQDKSPLSLPCSDFVTPWNMQLGREKMDVGMERGKLAKGAFGIDTHARWHNSNEQQLEFATRFSIPINEKMKLKCLSTDVPNTALDPTRCLSNATTKVLQCVRVMHDQTELDLMQGKYYEKVLLGLQRTSRELRQEMDSGPNGGLQGKPVDVLWKIYRGEELSNISDSTLRLVEIIAMAMQGSKGDELWPMVCTPYTDPYTKGKLGLTKVQCGVQTKRAYNFHEASRKGTRCAVLDVDPRLVRKVWTYRNGQQAGEQCDFDSVQKNFVQLSSLVHNRHQTNCPEMTGDEIKAEEQVTTDPVVMDMWIYKDILPVYDEVLKQTTTVSIEAIYLLAKSPANDPLVILKSIAENNPAASTLLSSTFAHMNNVLGQEMCSWDQLFNTDRAGAADVTPESRMVEGLFKFCNAQRLRNVNLGGFRMDVKDPKEMKVWGNYIEPLTAARRAHYREMIKETLHDRAHMREAHLPVENNSMWLDFYHGQIYWKMSLEQVDEEIRDYAAMWPDAEDSDDVLERLTEWKRSHYQTPDNLFMFVAEGEGWARNSGVWIKIRTDNSKSHDEERHEFAGKNKKSEDCVTARWSQPQQECRLAKLWFAHAKERTSGSDPLDIVLYRSKWIPDIKWMSTELPCMDEQPESLQWLREMIGDFVMVSSSKRLLGSINVRTQEIMQLVGKERNAIHKSLASIEEVCSIELLFRTRMQKIYTGIKNALVQMNTCELVQWRIAAMSIDDLKKQNIVHDKWVSDYKHVHELEQNLQESDEWSSLLCSGTMSCIFFNHSMARINADLSYMNQLFMWLFICCTMAHNENRRGAYGMTMRVMDLAGTVDVLKEADGKSNNRNTTVVKVTEKHPGSGADTTIAFVMQMLVNGLIHISITPELKEMASMARDTIHKNVSKLSYALFQGSGVLVNSRGEIMQNSLAYQKDLGNNGHFTELGKEDADAGMLGWIESLMAHSGDVEVGAESGVIQAAWTTTQSLENWNVERLKPMPVIVLTGNRPSPATPASAIEGARWMCIASSTQDKENGFFTVVKQEHVNSFRPAVPLFAPRAALGAMSASDMNRMQTEREDKSAQARLANKVSTADIRKDIKIINREIVHNNMLHFLLMQWLRKDAALLLSSLTHDAQCYYYSMKCTYGQLECAVGQLASGLRRDFLDKNAKFWHRNSMGPWGRVLQVSMHVYLTMSTALLLGMSRVSEGWPLDLHGSFMLGTRALMTNTVSFLAMLSSLHLWLACAVLDYNFMILCCYVYHFTAFQKTCSLRILSLVMAGHELEGEDLEAYMVFCRHLAPCVLERRMRTPRTDAGPLPVLSGTLQMPKQQVLQEWFTWFVTSVFDSIRTSHAARVQGPAQEKLSVYCQPRLSFVTKETIKGFGRAKEGQTHVPDPNICGTSSRVLATAMGTQQRPAAHKQRVQDGVEMAKHENTGDFWRKVQEGTALPESSTSTNDIFKVKFEFVPHTGLWWDTTMQNAGACDGVVKMFLLQSKLKPDISHFEFFTALMAPYLSRTRSTDRVYGGPLADGLHRNAWDIPVLSKQNVFEFTSNPYFDAQHQPQGVQVNICMRLVHYVLIQGLGLTKDWDVTAHDNSSFVSCIHLRNISQMTLGVLSLLLHTCCEKAMVPANHGRLRLPVPNPDFESKEEATIAYDNRLHVDTHLHSMGGLSDNMLCVDARLATPSNWTLLNFQSGLSALQYAGVLAECTLMQQASTPSQLFPFAPEAVAHVANMFKDMYMAYRRCNEAVEKDPDLRPLMTDNLFAYAMLRFGASIRFEDFQHIQPSLTNCVVQDAREIPCVTCEQGFLFSVSFRCGRLLVRAVTPTHKWGRIAEMRQDSQQPFQALPLPGLEESLPSSHFYKLFRHGLLLREADGAMTVHVDVSFNDEKRLPFYMFPVAHFPVLLRLRQNGWLMRMPEVYTDVRGDKLLLQSSEHFYSTHSRDYHMRSVETEAEWFGENCAVLKQLVAGCPELREVEVLFLSDDSSSPLGLWAKREGVRVHFCSMPHFELHYAKVHDTSLYVAPADASVEYLMLEHEAWGVVPVCYVQSHGAASLEARFSYIYDKSEDLKQVEAVENELRSVQDNPARVAELTETLQEMRADLDGQAQAREAFRPVFFSQEFNDFTANMQPVGEAPNGAGPNGADTEPVGACWGLVIENEDGVFLQDGRYTVSAVDMHPLGQTPRSSSFKIDFIAMSRCMQVEGSEVWIKINKEVYATVVDQAQEQGFKLMLPLSADLHENMPEQHSRYLRAFYTLGGSFHDQTLEDNRVRVICIIAGKRSIPGKKAAADDNASAASRVNQNIGAENTRFVAVSLPILLQDSSPVLDHRRDPAVPFYKYLKEDTSSRGR